jgi:hypothetical protein
MTVSSDLKDPSLYDGLAYFVPLATANEWMKEHEGQKQEVGSSVFAMLSWVDRTYSSANVSLMTWSIVRIL